MLEIMVIDLVIYDHMPLRMEYNQSMSHNMHQRN